jgi:hypothetical protein
MYQPEPHAPGRAAPARAVTFGMVDSTRVSLRIGTQLLYGDLRAVLQRITPQPLGPAARVATLPAVPIALTDTAGATRGQLILWNLWMEPDSTMSTRVANIEGLVIIRD